MTRWFVLGALIAVGALSLAVVGPGAARGRRAKAIAATKIEKVKDNLYIITGSGVEDTTAFSGGNTAVFITDAGVTLVDTKLPGYGQTILDRDQDGHEQADHHASSTRTRTATTPAATSSSAPASRASSRRTPRRTWRRWTSSRATRRSSCRSGPTRTS